MRTNDVAFLLGEILTRTMAPNDPAILRKINQSCREMCGPYPGPADEPTDLTGSVTQPERQREDTGRRVLFLNVTTPHGTQRFRLDITEVNTV